MPPTWPAPPLTWLMACVMESTMPPTTPAALAASFSVAVRSSTASFIICAASSRASCVWTACCRERSTSAPTPGAEHTGALPTTPTLSSHLRVPPGLLGRVEHLQGRLCQCLGLVQEVHLLLVIEGLGRCAHSCQNQGLKILRQLRHLEWAKGKA